MYLGHAPKHLDFGKRWNLLIEMMVGSLLLAVFGDEAILNVDRIEERRSPLLLGHLPGKEHASCCICQRPVHSLSLPILLGAVAAREVVSDPFLLDLSSEDVDDEFAPSVGVKPFYRVLWVLSLHFCQPLHLFLF